MIKPEIIEQRKREIEQRLNQPLPEDMSEPMFSASNIQYEMAERTRAINYGGIGLIHQLARESGLIEALDNKLPLLKIHLPYHESDHVLNIAYNALCEGRCLEDIELRRNDETFLDALGTERIPDPTTAGDFCRRFDSRFLIGRLRDAIDEARLNVWKRQPKEFFHQLDSRHTLGNRVSDPTRRSKNWRPIGDINSAFLQKRLKLGIFLGGHQFTDVDRTGVMPL